MRIALVATGSRGDAQPLVVLGDELRRRGHQVVLGVSPNLVAFGERAGLTTFPVGPDSQQFLESPDGQRWLAAGDVMALTQALGKIVHDNAALLDADTLRVCDGADLIVTGSLSEHRAACVAEAHGVTAGLPALRADAADRCLPEHADHHRAVAAPPEPGNAFDVPTDVLAQHGPGHQHLPGGLGLAPVSTPTATRLAAAGTLELQAYHPALVPDLVDYPAHRPIIGFLTPDHELRERLGELDVDPETDAWLTDGEPPVFVGFGSMPVIDPAATMDMITTATDRVGARVLIGAGWSRFGQHQAQGDRVRVATGVLNYDRVLPRCRVAVHHGGSGTVAASVAAGIPTFVCSLVADNPFWGARVEQLGIGVHERFADLDQDRLETGLRRALHPEVITRSRAIGDRMRADTGAAGRAADLIESKLPD